MKSVAFHFAQKPDSGTSRRYPAFGVALEM
jgi:hypothetical protein